MTNKDKLVFDLEAALNGSEVRTRDGRKVTDVKIFDDGAPKSADEVDEYNDEVYFKGMSVVIHNVGGLHRHEYYHDGGSHLYGLATDADLTTQV